MNWRYYGGDFFAFEQRPPARPVLTRFAQSPAFTTVEELSSGIHSLSRAELFKTAREKFDNWESSIPKKPFGHFALAASYLSRSFNPKPSMCSPAHFFFLNEQRFLTD